MVQFITFIIIFAAMMYIWSFVYLNKSKDKVNQAFLGFISIIMLWMVMSICNEYCDLSILGLVLRTIYWYSMMNISIFFLLFIYRLAKKKLDGLFYALVTVNELTILSRYLFPIDYTDLTFWRLSTPIVAPAMSTIFSLPALVGLFMLIRCYILAKDAKQRRQFGNITLGISIALPISVISEYVLPVLFQVDLGLSLMYLAFIVFAVFAFISIMKHRFMNLQSEYFYRKLLLNALDGVAIIDKHNRIIYINEVAKEILKNKEISAGDKMTDFIKEYDFKTNYKQHEITLKADGQEDYLTITQFPIDTDERDPAKMMTITDITSVKLKLQREKEMLIEKSTVDQLTGLYNKRYFSDAYSDGNSLGENAVVMFLDVDSFKSINDLYGHTIGDLVLKSVAVCIKDTNHTGAQAVRFGGDEFVVVFKNTTASEVYKTAEIIRKKVNELDFSQCDENLKISLSIGIAGGAYPIKDLTIKADMAMYSSKSGGKNRTTVFAQSESDSVFLDRVQAKPDVMKIK